MRKALAHVLWPNGLATVQHKKSTFLPELHLTTHECRSLAAFHRSTGGGDIPRVADLAQSFRPCDFLMRLQDDVHQQLLKHGGEYPATLRNMHGVNDMYPRLDIRWRLTKSFRASSLSFLGAMPVSGGKRPRSLLTVPGACDSARCCPVWRAAIRLVVNERPYSACAPKPRLDLLPAS